MKYITKSGHVWDLRKYWEYLASVQAMMPINIYTFASDTNNYDQSSPNSLHDAWLENVTISERYKSAPKKATIVCGSLTLLGPMHDRIIQLSYEGITNYRLVGSASQNEGHGDLLVHEMRVEREGVFEHEILFSGGTTLVIQFENFAHSMQRV